MAIFSKLPKNYTSNEIFNFRAIFKLRVEIENLDLLKKQRNVIIASKFFSLLPNAETVPNELVMKVIISQRIVKHKIRHRRQNPIPNIGNVV